VFPHRGFAFWKLFLAFTTNAANNHLPFQWPETLGQVYFGHGNAVEASYIGADSANKMHMVIVMMALGAIILAQRISYGIV